VTPEMSAFVDQAIAAQNDCLDRLVRVFRLGAAQRGREQTTCDVAMLLVEKSTAMALAEVLAVAVARLAESGETA